MQARSKRWLAAGSSLAALAMMFTAQPATAAPTTPPPAAATANSAEVGPGVLNDDFDGAAGSAPDPSVWGYETGRGFQGWGNWEKQFYTDSRNNSWLDGEGNLVIQAKYEAPGATQQYGDDAGNANNWETRWTSARLITKDKFDFQYGRAEARLKAPQGAGMWPAFWALGTEGEWPQSGELDIFEGASWRPDANLSNVFGGNDWNDLRMIDGWTDQGVAIGADFHTYAMEWTPDTIQFFFDGRLHHEVTRANMGSDWRASQPNYLILNVAVGGNFGGAFDADSGKDSTMVVDYVRVTDEQNPQPTGRLAISREWTSLGGLRGRLGDTARDDARTFCGLRASGCGQRFEGGLILWSPASGAHPVWGEIGRKYAEVGYENSTLGYPTSGEFCGLRDGGCGQRFQGGYIYWSPAGGVQTVWGAIAGKYAEKGWENSTLGYPTSGEFCGLRDGGCGQRFQGGYIYWTPATGAHSVWGAIAGKYADKGWETGQLAYPTSDEFCGLRDGGCAQRFQGGLIYWSPRSGAHPVWGAILDQYAAEGYERGRLAYPITDELVVPRGWEQRFQGGTLTWPR